MNDPVIIVPTGAANLASVRGLFKRLGITWREATGPNDIRDARAVVLPGVGAFGHAMDALGGSQGPMAAALRDRIRDGRVTLCICLGLQLLASASEESPGTLGLGVIDGVVQRLPESTQRVPQMGWNLVQASATGSLITDGHAYYANSYALRNTEALRAAGWNVATTHHATALVAAIERQGVLACQFHPELSGSWGQALIARWLHAAGYDVSATSPAPATQSTPGLCARVIPCLDVRDGRIVKGIRFQGLRDAGDPAERAAEYQRQGADELVMLDVSATPEGRATGVETVRALRAVLSIPLTVGGGVRSTADAARLLDAGADKVAVNSAAVERPELLEELAVRYGRQCVVLALDAARRGTSPASDPEAWEVVTRSGTHRTGIDAVQWAHQAERRGAGEILLTSWDRDGTGSGYDTQLLRAISEHTEVPIIASGGAAGPAHLSEALAAGADAVLAATIFHDAGYSVEAVKRELATSGVRVRL